MISKPCPVNQAGRVWESCRPGFCLFGMEDTLDTVLGLSMPKASEDTLKHLIPAGVRSAKRRINTADLRHVVDFGVWGRLGRWWARERFGGGRSGGVG